jgi:oxygen-dependent protoporphyrinogen oxidase
MIDVVVIGGGISGLSTAYELRRAGRSVAVLERQVRVGGAAITERFDGFLMEHGPSSVTADSVTTAPLLDAFGLDAMKCQLGPDVRYRYLLRDGGLHRIATHPLGMLTSNYLSPFARLRMLAELGVGRGGGGEDESVRAYFARRFGRAFADKVIDPLVSGLLAADADRVSMRSVFPILCDLERRYGSITAAVIRRGFSNAKMPARRLFSWRDGIGTLPMSLAAHLGNAVRTGVAVRRVVPVPGGFRIEAGRDTSLVARAVVVATQPHVAASLLDGVDEPAAAALGGIEAPPIAVVFLGYERGQVGHPLDGLGYLTPSSEERPLSGALFCSTMFGGRAPDGHVALAGYVGGSRAPELAQLARDELVSLVRKEFRNILDVRGAPVVTRVRQWPRGLPQPHIGHGQRVAALRDAEVRWPGLFITGNYFGRPSVGHCIAEADRTAARVAQHFERPGHTKVSVGA